MANEMDRTNKGKKGNKRRRKKYEGIMLLFIKIYKYL
jgi:hypothetical protein